MDDDIVEKLASFVLTKEEEDPTILLVDNVKVSQQECSLSALGKIITSRGINLGGLKAAMELAWGYP